LAGGVANNRSVWENMSVKELYKVLRPNHIKLKFSADFEKQEWGQK